jgi:hypothetical protein
LAVEVPHRPKEGHPVRVSSILDKGAVAQTNDLEADNTASEGWPLKTKNLSSLPWASLELDEILDGASKNEAVTRAGVLDVEVDEELEVIMLGVERRASYLCIERKQPHTSIYLHWHWNFLHKEYRQ